MYSYLSTSRGAGNDTHNSNARAKISGIDTYLPREGTETFPQVKP